MFFHFNKNGKITKISKRSSFLCCKCSPIDRAKLLKLSFKSTGLLQNPGRSDLQQSANMTLICVALPHLLSFSNYKFY